VLVKFLRDIAIKQAERRISAGNISKGWRAQSARYRAAAALRFGWSRRFVPTTPVIAVNFFMVRISTRNPSPNNVLSVGWWMLVKGPPILLDLPECLICHLIGPGIASLSEDCRLDRLKFSDGLEQFGFRVVPQKRLHGRWRFALGYTTWHLYDRRSIRRRHDIAHFIRIARCIIILLANTETQVEWYGRTPAVFSNSSRTQSSRQPHRRQVQC
jgi:hypothetical protein